jgi:ribosomal protein S18 acetylase RimI-like enzyme
MDFNIRKCKEEDLTALRDLSESVYYEAYKDTNSREELNTYIRKAFTLDQIQSELGNPRSEFYFLYLDGQLVGYFKLNEAPAQMDIHDPASLELQRIYMTGYAQRNGLGSYAMEHIVQIARQKGVQYIWLGVWEKQTDAIAFYRKHGFSEIGTHLFAVGNDIQTDYIMRKDI